MHIKSVPPPQLEKNSKSDWRPRTTSKEKEHNRLTNHCARCDVTVNNEICEHFRIKRPITTVIND